MTEPKFKIGDLVFITNFHLTGIKTLGAIPNKETQKVIDNKIPCKVEKITPEKDFNFRDSNDIFLGFSYNLTPTIEGYFISEFLWEEEISPVFIDWRKIIQ